MNGNIHHSACKWCYNDLDFDLFCREGKALGLTSIDLADPADFDTIKKHGLTCAMVSFPTATLADGAIVGCIEKAWNRLEHHDALARVYLERIDQTADAGFTNLICFSGNKEGQSDEEGIENCALGLQRILPHAEKRGVVITMELLNSKVEHPDYQCDHTAWGVALCRRIGSDNFKLLYDIYHMQVMEGDIIATIREFHPYFSHYHTGGAPGRNEINDTQELYYPAIMKAIIATGYKGHVAQEFVPLNPDKLASLREAVQICDI